MLNNEQLEFYKKNGYVVLKNYISSKVIDELDLRYINLREKLAEQSGLTQQDYDREISQIRDIWTYDLYYKSILLEGEISKAAKAFFDEGSCRLLHDHIINKPKLNNGIVPWHQDYSYWPIDNPNGLSLWLPFSNLDKNAGVLEVVPGSHLLGEASPVDFMNDNRSFTSNETVHLSVQKGDLVVLHSLCWHRTSKNSSVNERKAYISLWIPSHSRYAPRHASWHPVNDNINVGENEILNDDFFPVVGNYSSEVMQHKYEDNSYTNSLDKITMFNASKLANRFLKQSIDVDDLWKYLYCSLNRSNSVDKLLKKYKLGDFYRKELDSILLSMSVNGIAYQNHRGRNVYNDSYLKLTKIFKNEI